MKGLTGFWHLAFIILLLLSYAVASALDAPHTNTPGYGIECGSCHWTHSSTPPSWMTIVNYPDPADNTINNLRCYTCHDGSKTITAAKTHSSSTTSSRFWSTQGGWTIECVKCHDPHQQRQTWAWGTSSHLDVGPPPVTIGPWDTTGNFSQVTLAGPVANNYFGYYFKPDKTRHYYYKVLDDTTNSDTFRVKGGVVASAVQTGGYAFVYGKNVREGMWYTNPGGQTVGGTVKLFRPGGTNGPADAANTSTSVCYVCHTITGHWSAANPDTHRDGTVCTACHKHLAGFSACGGQWSTTLALDFSDCNSCHRIPMCGRRQIVDSNGDGTGTGGDFIRTSHHLVNEITLVYSPTATAAGTGGFTNPANAFLSDNSYAAASTTNYTQLYYDYNISLAGYAISGLQVGYEAYTAGNERLAIAVSWNGGTSWSTEVASPSLSTADPNAAVYIDFSAATSWDAAKVNNANLRVRVKHVNSSTASTNYYDWIPVRITYRTNAATNADCVICHETSLHPGGPVRLKDADTGTIYTYDPASPATAEGFCLSCHDANGANGNLSPFSDGKTLGTIPWRGSVDIQTNWNKSYGHRQQGLTCLGDGSPNTGCHGNGHGSDYVGLLSRNMTLPNPSTSYYSPSDESSYDICFSCHQSYPRVTKEAILGYRLGGNYDVNGDGPPPYNILDILTNFRDRNGLGSGKFYDDPQFYTGQYANMHYFHVQSGGWTYRGKWNASMNCIACHNVHGSNTQWGWVHDEIQYNRYTAGSDQYGTMDVLNYSTLGSYPTNCTFNCHNIQGKSYNWFEPSGE